MVWMSSGSCSTSTIIYYGRRRPFYRYLPLTNCNSFGWLTESGWSKFAFADSCYCCTIVNVRAWPTLGFDSGGAFYCKELEEFSSDFSGDRAWWAIWVSPSSDYVPEKRTCLRFVSSFPLCLPPRFDLRWFAGFFLFILGEPPVIGPLSLEKVDSPGDTFPDVWAIFCWLEVIGIGQTSACKFKRIDLAENLEVQLQFKNTRFKKQVYRTRVRK